MCKRERESFPGSHRQELELVPSSIPRLALRHSSSVAADAKEARRRPARLLPRCLLRQRRHAPRVVHGGAALRGLALLGWWSPPCAGDLARSLARSLACLLGSNSATMLTTRPTSCCSTTCLGPGSLKLATTVVLEIPGANLGQEGAHAGAHGGAHAVRAALMMQPRPERASEPGGGGGGCGPRTGRRPTD